ncbi:MAG: hypothetical protein KBA40_00340 [Candidatus Peribacteraceae bacterium]|nr:hypothetical protein [Candidatus Peribacteraceae bacterium]MBP9850272.1 hypothetical protein [Candidatus Peribacteraceae bacterium]
MEKSPLFVYNCVVKYVKTNIMRKLTRHRMSPRIKAFSGSKFVQTQILDKLPRKIRIEFIPELTDEGEPIMVITSPDFPGILSEAKTRDEAIANAHDAILTFFDVPKRFASMVEYSVEELPESTKKTKEVSKPRLESFTLACA